MQQDPLTVVLALTASVLFGAAVALTPFGLRYVRPATGATISIPSAALLLWLTAPWFIDRGGADIRALAIFLAIGLLFPVGVTVLTFLSNARLGASTTAALGNLAPLFAIIFAIVLLAEVPRPVQIVGLGVVVAGVMLLALGRGGFAVSTGMALLLPLAAAGIRGLVQPVGKFGLALWPEPLAAVLAGYTASAIGVLLLGRGLRVLPSWSPSAGHFWFAAIGCCNAGAVLFLYAALSRGTVGTVAPLVGTYPLVTLLLEIALFRNAAPGLTVVAGVVVTVAGILILIVA